MNNEKIGQHQNNTNEENKSNMAQYRIVSNLIDYVILMVITFVLSTLMVMFFMLGEFSFEIMENTAYISILLVTLAYFMLFEIGSKRATIGKRIQKIKVVNINGEEATNLQIILRNIIKCLPAIIFVVSTLILSLIGERLSLMFFGISFSVIIFSIVCLFILLKTKDNIGLHGIISRTKVISIK